MSEEKKEKNSSTEKNENSKVQLAIEHETYAHSTILQDETKKELSGDFV